MPRQKCEQVLTIAAGGFGRAFLIVRATAFGVTAYGREGRRSSAIDTAYPRLNNHQLPMPLGVREDRQKKFPRSGADQRADQRLEDERVLRSGAGHGACLRLVALPVLVVDRDPRLEEIELLRRRRGGEQEER